MTDKWYDEYYKEEYRNQMARFKGLDRATEYTPDIQFKKAFERGKKFGEIMKPYINNGLTIEIGSNAGGVLAAFKEIFSVPVLGIEPSLEASNFARNKEIETISSTFENLDKEVPRAENILCLRTLNHMLDPKGFVVWANDHLRVGGHLLLEVMNFVNVAKQFHYLPRAIQIDHVYMFTDDTLKQFIEALGFKVMFLDTQKKPGHLYLAARKTRDADVKHALQGDYSNVYRHTKETISGIHNSFMYYLIRFGIKRRILILNYAARRAVKKILIYLGLWRKKTS